MEAVILGPGEDHKFDVTDGAKYTVEGILIDSPGQTGYLLVYDQPSPKPGEVTESQPCSIPVEGNHVWQPYIWVQNDSENHNTEAKIQVQLLNG